MLIHSIAICSMTPFHLHFTDGETEAQRSSEGQEPGFEPRQWGPVSRLITSAAASSNACMLSIAPAFPKHAIQHVVVPKGVKSDRQTKH